MVIWYFIGLILCLFLFTEYYAFKTGVPTVVSFPSARRTMVEILRKYAATYAGVLPMTIIDLGSGNGQVAAALARALPHAKVIGIEISPVPWAISWARQKLFGPRNVEFLRTDFWTYDCATTDVVVTYLTENIIERVGEKLRHELKPNALIVANDTALRGDWKPIETVPTKFLGMEVYLYRQR